MAANPDAQIHRLKIGLFGRLEHFLDALAGQRQQFLTGLARDPSLKGKRLFAGRELHERPFAAPGISYHIPAVARGGSGVNNDAARAPRRSVSSYLYVP